MAVIMTELHITEHQFRTEMSPFSIFACMTFWEIKSRVESDEADERKSQPTSRPQRKVTILDEAGNPAVWDPSTVGQRLARPVFDPANIPI